MVLGKRAQRPSKKAKSQSKRTKGPRQIVKKKKPLLHHPNGLLAPDVTIEIPVSNFENDQGKKYGKGKNNGAHVTVTELPNGYIEKEYLSFSHVSTRNHIRGVVEIMNYISSLISHLIKKFKLKLYFMLPKVMSYTDDSIKFERAQGIRLDSKELGDEEYRKAIESLKKAKKFFNDLKIFHNDLNRTNLFWDPKKKILTIIDWDEVTLHKPRPRCKEWWK